MEGARDGGGMYFMASGLGLKRYSARCKRAEYLTSMGFYCVCFLSVILGRMYLIDASSLFIMAIQGQTFEILSSSFAVVVNAYSSLSLKK